MLIKLGYFIAHDKTEIDAPKFDFIGYAIDLNKKRIGIKIDTIQKMQDSIDENIVEMNDSKFFEIRALESLLGRINFVAGCTDLGLSKVLHLQLEFIKASKNNKSYVWISPAMQQELDYWTNLLPGTSMPIMKFTIMHCQLHLPGLEPEICASDSSKHKYGYKIFSSESLLSSGAGDFGSSLEERLSALAFNIKADWKSASIDKLEFLAFFLREVQAFLS